MKIETIDIEDKRIDAILSWAKNPSNIISVLPNVVGVESNMVVKLRFRRFLIFTFEGEFVVEPTFMGSGIVEDKLTDKKGNEIKIIISAQGKSGVKLSVSYSGEKEWIVGKGLRKMLEEISKGIEKELSRLPEVKQGVEGKDYSLSLSKISSISKLIMKSKLVKTEYVSLKEGELLSYVEDIISEFVNYPLIYISGAGTATFRLLFLKGELKGTYILKDGKDSFNEEDLNHLSGEFKIHVYVGISPRILEVLEGER